VSDIKAIRILLAVTMASLLLAPNCASLSRSRTQRIPVTSSPLGAAVSVNGRPQGVTPLSLRLGRNARNQVIRIESPGYDPIEIRLIRQPAGAPFFGNLLLGLMPAIVPASIYSLMHDGQGFLMTWTLGAAAFGMLFTAVDSGTGAINDFEPKDVSVRLTKADGTPRVVTKLVVVEDVRNVKWIRVRRD
jgi:hypothetical protein